MSTIERAFAEVARFLNFLPDAVTGLLLLAIAAAGAIVIHRLILRIALRVTQRGHPYLKQIIQQTTGPTRLGVVIILMAAALAAAPFRAVDKDIFQHLLLIGFITLIGWGAATALNVACEVYSKRFALDVEDNLIARKHVTQVRILKRATLVLVTLLTLGAILVTFDGVREYGVSLLASAGAAGLVVGLAAQPVLSNLIAGIQLAITQPIRIEDAVVVEGEWGWIDEITMTYIVIRLWDWRRLVVPIRYFIEQPFQNWTRNGAAIIGSVLLRLDYTVPIDKLRAKAEEITRASPLWDGQVTNVQVTDAGEHTIEVRILVSSRNSPKAWDLRCEVREKIITWLQTDYPGSLPRTRAELSPPDGAQAMFDGQWVARSDGARTGGEMRPHAV
ncbi:mechanosensitive ion channel family protein [Consotaella aegiceratis]|uniref:mechanosensitive ion channel family protein n=1 Tax=Consotaella aegiceratis TaxID=3097961 RepID=UPI002F41F5B4